MVERIWHEILFAGSSEDTSKSTKETHSLHEIENLMSIDNESLIDYFVQGIRDTTVNKSSLYQARNVDNLKEKLKTIKDQNGWRVTVELIINNDN